MKLNKVTATEANRVHFSTVWRYVDFLMISETSSTPWSNGQSIVDGRWIASRSTVTSKIEIQDALLFYSTKRTVTFSSLDLDSW